MNDNDSSLVKVLQISNLAEIEEGREAGGNVLVSLGRVRLQKHEALGGKRILVRSEDEMLLSLLNLRNSIYMSFRTKYGFPISNICQLIKRSFEGAF